MNKKQLSYIEIIKKIDEVFPLVSKFDYTKISPEELWDKLYDALDGIGLIDRLDNGELDKLKHITSQQQDVYGKTYTVHSNVASSREHGFNQKNYFINNKVMQMREEVFELLEEKHMIRFVRPGIRHYQGEDLIEEYSDNMGSIDEVREYIDPESIEDYIKELFDFTKEDNDNFNVEVLLLYRTIMHHYGFSTTDADELRFLSEFENAIGAASNSVYLNGVLDGTTLNESRFREKIVEVIKELIRFVKKSTKYSFERREELNERKKVKPNTDSDSQASSIEKIQKDLAGLKAALNDLRQQSYGGMEEPVEEDTYGDEGSSFKPGS